MNNNFQEYNEKEYNNVEKKEKKKSIRNKVTLFIVLLIVCFFSTYFIVDRLTNSKYKDVSDNQSKTAVFIKWWYEDNTKSRWNSRNFRNFKRV